MRLRFMESQFKTLNLSAKRIEGVNGYDPAVIACSSAAPYAPLPKGEIGCFESHRAAWSQIVDQDLLGAIILEDDVAVASDFGLLIFPDNIISECDVIKLDTYPRDCFYGSDTVKLSETRHIQRLLGTENSAGCYFLTNRGARKLLGQSRNYFLPVDIVMFAQESKTFWDLTVWKVFPSVATQLRFYIPEEELPNEVKDGIQAKRRSERDPRATQTWKRKTQIRLRRLRDWDFRWARNRRIRRHLSKIAQNQSVTVQCVQFSTPDWTHINVALEKMR